MDFDITPEANEMKKTIRRFVEREIEPLALQIEEQGIIPPHLIQGMKELGLFGLIIPPEYDGLGLSILDQCLVYEELGRANGCIRTYMGTNNGPAVESIITAGSPEQKKKFLPPAARGDLLAAFAVSEPDSGSNIAGINTSAQRDGDQYILNGAKFYITMGDLADFVVVLAYTDKSLGPKKGMSAFVLEKGFQGFSVGAIDQKMGLNGSNTCELVFDECPVPAGNLVGGEGNGYQVVMNAITRGRVTIGAVALGAAGKLLDMAVEYSGQRIVAGRPLGDLQAIQMKLADMATEVHAARMMVYHAAWLGDQGKNMVKEASMAKLFATEMVNRAAYQALQIFGGMGYMKETQVERIARDVRALTIYEGTSEIQRLTIGRHLLR